MSDSTNHSRNHTSTPLAYAIGSFSNRVDLFSIFLHPVGGHSKERYS